MKRKIVVTGAGGFLGRAIVNALATDTDNEVWALDNNDRGSLLSIEARPNIVFKQCDVCDGDTMNEVMVGAEVVLHLAAVNGTKNFYETPDKVLEVGIIGTHNVVRSCIKSRVPYLLFVSSSEVYQEPEMFPTPEEVVCRIPDMANPRFSYAGSKIAGELMTINYTRNTSTQFNIIRPHNVYGPNMGFDHVVPELIRKLVLSQRMKSKIDQIIDIDIEGTGRETRSFIFVDDAVDAIRLVMDKGLRNSVYNVGTQNEVTIRELANKIGQVASVELRTRSVELRRGGAVRRCPDTSKLKMLGFVSRFSLLDGLGVTVPWYWSHFSNV